MKLDVEIEISDEMIKQCANAAANALFKVPEWGREGAIGYKLIAAQVEAAVKSLDVTAIAKETTERYAKGIVEDVTKSALKTLAKNVVKEMKDAGELA